MPMILPKIQICQRPHGPLHSYQDPHDLKVSCCASFKEPILVTSCLRTCDFHVAPSGSSDFVADNRSVKPHLHASSQRECSPFFQDYELSVLRANAGPSKC